MDAIIPLITIIIMTAINVAIRAMNEKYPKKLNRLWNISGNRETTIINE